MKKHEILLSLPLISISVVLWVAQSTIITINNINVITSIIALKTTKYVYVVFDVTL
jgi:hypothetical protein